MIRLLTAETRGNEKVKMKNENRGIVICLCVLLVVTSSVMCFAQAGTAPSIPKSQLIQPANLAKTLQGTGKRPVILNVGPHSLFAQAHIQGSEYVGAGSTPDGVQKLKTRVQSLRKTDAIVLYCGCCPWEHCPNVAPAYNALRKEGFSNVKVLYIANNFGADWAYKGYPTAKGD